MLSPKEKLMESVLNKFAPKKTDGDPKKLLESDEEDRGYDSVACEGCMEDFLSALASKDTKGMSDALYDFFSLLEAVPHEEASDDDEGFSEEEY